MEGTGTGGDRGDRDRHNYLNYIIFNIPIIVSIIFFNYTLKYLKQI